MADVRTGRTRTASISRQPSPLSLASGQKAKWQSQGTFADNCPFRPRQRFAPTLLGEKSAFVKQHSPVVLNMCVCVCVCLARNELNSLFSYRPTPHGYVRSPLSLCVGSRRKDLPFVCEGSQRVQPKKGAQAPSWLCRKLECVMARTSFRPQSAATKHLLQVCNRRNAKRQAHKSSLLCCQP